MHASDRELLERTLQEIRDFREKTTAELREVRDAVTAKLPLVEHRLTVVERSGVKREERLQQVEKNQVRYSALFAGLGALLGYIGAAVTKRLLG